MLQARNSAVDAEARADEASSLTDRLLAEHYNEWVPHWVAYGYETVRRFAKCLLRTAAAR